MFVPLFFWQWGKKKKKIFPTAQLCHSLTRPLGVSQEPWIASLKQTESSGPNQQPSFPFRCTSSKLQLIMNKIEIKISLRILEMAVNVRVLRWKQKEKSEGAKNKKIKINERE